MFPDIDYSKRKIDYKNRKKKSVNYNAVMQIRVSDEFKQKLMCASHDMEKSISDIIRDAVNNYIDNYRSDI